MSTRPVHFAEGETHWEEAAMRPSDSTPAFAKGLTPNEVARLLRVSADRVRSWIRSGHLGAINTAAVLCGKPRFVVLPHHLEEFVRLRRAAPPPQPRRPRRRQDDMIDYYPD